MNHEEVTAEHMSALKALSDTNLKVSEARNSLTKLEETETEYLISRERKALERIENTLKLSHNLVEETNKNYDLISDFARSVSEGATFLSEAAEKFGKLIEEKDTFYQNWERDITNQEETITALRNNLKVEAVTIDAQRKQLDMRNLELNKIQRKLDDERGIIDRKIKRLQENRT